RITATISSTVGGSGGYRRPLFLGASPWWKLASVAGDRRRPARSSNGVDSMMSSSGRPSIFVIDASPHHRITASPHRDGKMCPYGQGTNNAHDRRGRPEVGQDPCSTHRRF